MAASGSVTESRSTARRRLHARRGADRALPILFDVKERRLDGLPLSSRPGQLVAITLSVLTSTPLKFLSAKTGQSSKMREMEQVSHCNNFFHPAADELFVEGRDGLPASGPCRRADAAAEIRRGIISQARFVRERGRIFCGWDRRVGGRVRNRNHSASRNNYDTAGGATTVRCAPRAWRGRARRRSTRTSSRSGRVALARGDAELTVPCPPSPTASAATAERGVGGGERLRAVGPASSRANSRRRDWPRSFSRVSESASRRRVSLRRPRCGVRVVNFSKISVDESIARYL